MTHNYDIRALTEDDIPTVTALYKQILEPSYISFSELAEGKAERFGVLNPDAADIFGRQLSELWQHDDHGFFVATVGAEIAGFALSSVHKTEAGHSECWLDDIGVGIAWQHEGVATTLTYRVLEWSAERGCKYTLLESGILNTSAHKVFEDLGFKAISTVFWRPAA